LRIIALHACIHTAKHDLASPPPYKTSPSSESVLQLEPAATSKKKQILVETNATKPLIPQPSTLTPQSSTHCFYSHHSHHLYPLPSSNPTSTTTQHAPVSILGTQSISNPHSTPPHNIPLALLPQNVQKAQHPRHQHTLHPPVHRARTERYLVLGVRLSRRLL
jgi:hypothetical protein